MAYVNPGELKWRVKILAPIRTLDANGHYATEMQTLAEVYAAVRAVRAADVLEYGAARAEETLQFIMNWRTGLNTDMAIEWRGRRYAIESIDPTPFAGMYMRIRAVSYDEVVGG